MQWISEIVQHSSTIIHYKAVIQVRFLSIEIPVDLYFESAMDPLGPQVFALLAEAESLVVDPKDWMEW
jgi:hypothetical protein